MHLNKRVYVNFFGWELSQLFEDTLLGKFPLARPDVLV